MAACSIVENNIFPGHSLKTETGVNMAGCAFLCFGLTECKFWTYNPKYVIFFASLTICFIDYPSAGCRTQIKERFLQRDLHKGLEMA